MVEFAVVNDVNDAADSGGFRSARESYQFERPGSPLQLKASGLVYGADDGHGLAAIFLHQHVNLRIAQKFFVSFRDEAGEFGFGVAGGLPLPEKRQTDFPPIVPTDPPCQ